MSWKNRFLIWLSRSLLNKLQKTYQRKFKQKMPIILVTGTAGKSSITLLLDQLFTQSGYTVFTGATPNHCLNTLIGIPMVLANFSVRFESKEGRLFKGLSYLWQSLEILWFGSYRKIPKESILIYECGYDSQDESTLFMKVFDSIDMLVVTAATAEHSANYQTNFDKLKYFKIRDFLPEKWREIFENAENPSRLRNIALEQMTFLPRAKSAVLPTDLSTISSDIIVKVVVTDPNSQQETCTPDWQLMEGRIQRGPDFALVVNNDWVFSADYLLPRSFGKNALILDQVAKTFNLDTKLVAHILREMTLPAGRFSLLEGINNTAIVDSSYNSDPASLSAFLDLLEEVVLVAKELPDSIPPKHYLILGEMRELGNTATSEHQKILDKLITLGQKYGDYIENILLLGKEWLTCDDTGIKKSEDQVSYISYQKQMFKVYLRAGHINRLLTPDNIRPHAWFWIKGSQNTIFLEIVVKHLLAKPEDESKLCRRSADWDEVRAWWE
jgi:UDP-N-acetylmuramyl pentapeptide synthase